MIGLEEKIPKLSEHNLKQYKLTLYRPRMWTVKESKRKKKIGETTTQKSEVDKQHI